jgi:hypothetical protein
VAEMSKLNIQNKLIRSAGSTDALKESALVYLNEALSREEYEQCGQIIEGAKELGVTQDEIQKVLNQHIANLIIRDRSAGFARRK